MNLNNLPPNIKGIVFDIGNVLIPYDEKRVVLSLLADSKIKDDEKIRLAVFRSVASYLFQIDFLKPAEFYEKIRDALGLNLSETDFFQQYSKTFLEPNSKMVNFLQAAKTAGLKVSLLSNLDKFLYHYLLTKYSWLNQVDYLAISWQWRLLKPDLRLLEAVEKKLSLQSHQIFYLDDFAKNIAVAQARGWQVQQYCAPYPSITIEPS